jgi:peptidoglycan/LPS O-acetylase OafA/YrhL
LKNKTSLKTATSAEQHRFHFLDALRGIAAVLVVPRHAPPGLGNSLMTHSSFLAVDFFFCLSGFVIAFSYETRLANKLTWVDFTITRVIRLYPIAILSTAIGLLAYLLNHSPSGHHLPAMSVLPLAILGCLILPFPHHILFPFDVPMWTLFLEFWGNMAYGALVRIRCAGTYVLGFLCTVALTAVIVAGHNYGTLDVGFTSQRLWAGFARVILSFFVGVLVYRLYQRKRVPRLSHSWAAVAAWVLVLTFAAVLIANPLGASAAFQLISVIVVFPIVIFVGAEIALPAGWAALCAFLGTISYPLYLVHQPFLALCGELQSNIGRASGTAIAFYFAALVAFAWLIAKFYDAPVRKALTRFAKHHQTSRSLRLAVEGCRPISN